MSNRIELSDLQFNGTPLLNKKSEHIYVKHDKKQVIVTGGNDSTFFGFDGYIAAIMLKYGIKEVTLTEEDLNAVETVGVDWKNDSKEVTLTANQLPEKGDNILVYIVEHWTGQHYDKTHKVYWDFYSEGLTGFASKVIVLVPKELEGDIEGQKSFIDAQYRAIKTDGFMGYKPLKVKNEHSHGVKAVNSGKKWYQKLFSL